MTTKLRSHTPGRSCRIAPLFRAVALCAPLFASASITTAQTAPTTPAAPPAPSENAGGEEVVVLSTFTVSAESVDRYRAADAVSAVRVRADLIDTASSISVVTREMMDDISPNRIFDVTRYVAGVQEGRGIQFQDRMIIRGFETQNGARTVDTFLQSADADNVEESVIDRIEVTKGPNAILSPAGAPGGSVNVITKSPTFQKQGSLTAVVGSFDAQKLTLDVGGPLGSGEKTAYRLIGTYQDTQRYWSSDAKMKNRSLAPMFTWRLSDKTQLTVKLIAADHWIYREPLLILDPSVTASTDKPFLAPGLSRKDLNGIQPWSHVGTESVDTFAVLTTSFNEHLSLRVAANYRYYFEDSDQEFLGTPGLSNRYNPATGELTQDYTWTIVNNQPVSTFSPFFNPYAIPVRGQKQATYRRTSNFQTDLAGNYKFGNISSQTVGGLAYSKQDADGKVWDPGTLPPVDLRNPGLPAYPVYATSPNQYQGSSYRNVQAYVNQRFGFMEDRLYVTAGVLRYDTHTTTHNLATGALTGELDDAKNTWSASALFKIQNNVSVYYSHSTNSSPVIANNLPLWRDGEQDEAGVKTEFFQRKLSFNAAWFQITQTNVTIPNPARQTDPTAPQQLISDFGNDGLEFELMGRISDNMSAIATYSKLNMRDSLGRKVRAVADNNASLLLNYRFSDDSSLKGLAVNFGVSYSGRRAGDIPGANFMPAPFSTVIGQVSFYLEPEYLTTLGISYRLNDKVSFRLIIDNVLDDKHYISVAGGRVSGTGITMAPGQNVRLSTTLKF